MTRFITIILLLLVFFFGGMSYGSYERDRQPEQSEDVFVAITEMEQDDNVMSLQSSESEPLQRNNENYKVHKTASFLEQIVTSTYEFVIEMMYTIASLFFD